MAEPNAVATAGRAVVAVIGGGASGTLTAAHLAAAAGATQRGLQIMLIEPDAPGRGLAYRTADPRHRLNVPAKAMSAWPQDPGHFLRWLRRHLAGDIADGAFVSRLHYGQYLADVLDQAVQDNATVTVDHIRHRVTDLRTHGNRLRVSLDDGTSRAVDAAVLALGHGAPSSSWAPGELVHSSRFVADPWRTSTVPQLRRGDDVVLVGAGLTAADMAQSWARDGIRVHVVSRHGMLPLPHSTTPTTPLDLAGRELPRTLSAARRFVFASIREAGGDWRRAIDGLRPHTQRLWRELDDAARARFFEVAVRRWDRVRHRVDPALHSWLEQRRAEGSLVVHAAHVTAAQDAGSHVHIELSDGSSIAAAAVLNCTGTCTSVSGSDDPLLLNMLSAGLVRPGPLDLGVATDDNGRVCSSAAEQPPLWAIGTLRRGQLWETTAIPEIRVQAAELATEVLAALPRPDVRRRPRDPYGLPISASDGAATAYVAGLRRILRVQSGAESLLATAVQEDPQFALGHAVLALLGTEWGVPVDVERALRSATASHVHADERERRFIEVAQARVTDPGAGSAAALLAYIHTYPEDALAVSIAVPTIAFGGATEIPAEAWALVEGLAPAYRDDWWYLGMLAFIRQEQERYGEAFELSARALAFDRSAGHAVHAKAHAHYETGDHRVGLAWLDDWIRTCGGAASHRAHFSWHAALHELALNDDAAVVSRFTEQLAPPEVTGVRALVDSASLLWRLRLDDGSDGVTNRSAAAAVLRTIPEQLLAEPATPFIAMHAALAMAAADDCRGLARLRRWAQRRGSGPFVATIAPLAAALSELVHDDADLAFVTLNNLPGVTQLGGSAAQREAIEDTLLHCAISAGRLGEAHQILAERLARRRSPRDEARLRALRTETVSSD
jgi:uncharacterized NAD(P)/FAD-binding protein YdhS